VALYGFSDRVSIPPWLRPERREVARLDGFDIRMCPLANIVPSPPDSVYGVLCDATQRELARLYGYARDVLGGVYLPDSVTVETRDGRAEPALCYIASEMADHPPAADYADRVVRAARSLGFPDRYVARLESFRP